MNDILKNTTTKIFLDSGDPAETTQSLELLGSLDGQTTNPSLIAKSPEVQKFLEQGKFSRTELFKKYQDISLHIHELLPTGDISAEVYADENSTADELLDQAYTIAEWFSGIFVKLPITTAGLATAQQLVTDGISVNMTLCFSQDQAAAVHMATKNAQNGARVYVSPFIGRLDDIGENGSDLIENIQAMYREWGSHVGVLGASIRSVEHIQLCIDEQISAITIPFKLIKEIHDNTTAIAEVKTLSPIAYKKLEELPWNEYDIEHELTTKGLAKFASDWNELCV